MRTRKTLLTAEELLHLPTRGRLELVRGELYEMPPAGARHGGVAMRVGILLGGHVHQHGLGEVFAAETGFILQRNTDTVLAPDASFVARDRLPSGELPTGFLELAPDLAVEVVSPGDTASEVQEKVEAWLRAGSRLVWVVYPATNTVTVHRSSGDVNELSGSDTLDAGEVVPGFSCQATELFA